MTAISKLSIPGRYKVLKQARKFPIFQVLGLGTATTTFLGFGVGGAGMLYEGIRFDGVLKDSPPWLRHALTKVGLAKKLGLEPQKPETSEITKPQPPIPPISFEFPTVLPQVIQPPVPFPPVFTVYNQPPANRLQPYFGEALKAKNDFEVEGVKDLVAVSPFGRIALRFAKVGVALSGLAGIMNGIAMRLPLMAFGESFVLGASPNIEKAYGLGLFHVGLAGVFAGRALELDPARKMNMQILRNKQGIAQKTGYVLQNMLDTVKVIGRSNATLLKNIGKLVTPKAKEALSFFRHEVFNIRPRKVWVTELMTQSGKTFLKTGMKSSPYLMHFASTILALGGFTLTIGSLIKNNLMQRLGFMGCVTGGSLDNLGLSKMGLEKISFASGLLGKLTGGVMGLSGITILSGQHKMDEKAWRGLMWVGTGLLFSVFMLERAKELPKLIARSRGSKEWANGMWEEATQVVRQFELDPSKLITKIKYRKLLNDVMNAGYDGPMEQFNDPKAFLEGLQKLRQTQPKVTEAITFLFERLHGKRFDSKSVEIMAEFRKRFPEIPLTQTLGEGADLKLLMQEIVETNTHRFGKNVVRAS